MQIERWRAAPATYSVATTATDNGGDGDEGGDRDGGGDGDGDDGNRGRNRGRMKFS